MKRKPIFEVVIILWVLVVVLVSYSFIPKNISIGKFEIKKPGFKDVLEINDTIKAIRAITLTSLKDKTQVKTDTSSQSILLTGDSMCEGLFFAFRDYCKYNNHKFKAVPVYSSSTMSFATTDTLNKMINKYQPTYVILALGSNELFIKDIKKNRDQYVKSIIRKIGKRKYIWIGPPNWKKDTGINDMIASNVPRNQFFVSKDLKFQRISDGAHPTRAASRDWADTIATWVMKKSNYPILLNKPPKDFQKKVEKPIIKTIVKSKPNLNKSKN